MDYSQKEEFDVDTVGWVDLNRGENVEGDGQPEKMIKVIKTPCSPVSHAVLA